MLFYQIVKNIQKIQKNDLKILRISKKDNGNCLQNLEELYILKNYKVIKTPKYSKKEHSWFEKLKIVDCWLKIPKGYT